MLSFERGTLGEEQENFLFKLITAKRTSTLSFITIKVMTMN